MIIGGKTGWGTRGEVGLSPHTSNLQRGRCGEGWTPQSVSSNRSCLQWLEIVDSGSASGQNQMERSLSNGHFSTFPICSHRKWVARAHSDKKGNPTLTRRHTAARTNTDTQGHTSAHYVKYQMVKQTLWSRGGELGWLSSHACWSFWVSEPHTPALSSLHPGSQRGIRIFHPEPCWNRANKPVIPTLLSLVGRNFPRLVSLVSFRQKVQSPRTLPSRLT